MPNYASVVTLCDSININNKTIWQDFTTQKEWIRCMPKYASFVTLRDSINIFDTTYIEIVRDITKQDEIWLDAKLYTVCDIIHI